MSFTIRGHLRHESEPVKGSRFIVDLMPVADEPAARVALGTAQDAFPDASHHCWAWRIASPAIERASDDGEPSGSAGRPILAQLVGRDLVDVAAIVTRYFGGTKLGVGGLVRAYGGAVGLALDTMDLVPWVEQAELTFSHGHALTDLVERLLTQANGVVIARTFGVEVNQHVQLPSAEITQFVSSVADATAGAVIIEQPADQ